MFEAKHKVLPENQLSRAEILKLVESQEEFLFVIKQDRKDVGVIVSANLSNDYEESYGTVRMQGQDDKIFCTDIANIEFIVDDNLINGVKDGI